MRTLFFFSLLFFALPLWSGGVGCNDRLYYTSPASVWEETLPLGNGRLGMMPNGGVERERIVLNEISMWSGMEADYGNPDAARSLSGIRQLLFAGRNQAAQELMYKSFVPTKPELGGTYGTYQMLACLDIDFAYGRHSPAGHHLPTATHYCRELDLSKGVARTTFALDGINYQRTYFVDRNRDLIIVHLAADRPAALTFTAMPHRDPRSRVTAQENTLLLGGHLDSGKQGVDGLAYRLAMRIFTHGGKQETTAQHGIVVTQATEAWLLISATTSFEAEGTTFAGPHYKHLCDSLLAAVTQPGKLLPAHAAAHAALYQRVSVQLPPSPHDTLPTNERINHFSAAPAPALAALYYNYGRYLLISSTRPGSLPPNLQGLWANSLQTPWNGDYHANINVQMNHWPLEQAALPELYQPLISLVERLVPSGEKTARTFYGPNARGWVLHMMTNVWNYTAPGEHPSWGATNTGGAWLCMHLWERYLYGKDPQYLARIYPVLKGASQFFYSTMVAEPRHQWLVTAPTSSPENAFYTDADSAAVSICMGSTMDVQLLTELYSAVVQAARLLQCDAPYVRQLEAALKRFPPLKISPKGYLQEWLEDYAEADVHHRHVSHLYGLYPGHLISTHNTPQLAQACRLTLDRRGDGGTGWSRAWKINFWARLGDGNRAWQLFKSLLQPAITPNAPQHQSGTYPNLFCAHPPFQIDGNYGGAAGIAQMLLQSTPHCIDLLPALPQSWHTGNFRGMRVHGGAAIDLDWENHRPTQATLKALVSNKFILKMPQGAKRAQATINGRQENFSAATIELNLKQGHECRLSFQY